MAILDGVTIVGETAAWSASGRWFAFTARPTSGFQGPDVYVWTPDEPMAHPLTRDGRSVFSAWLGEWIVASRVEEQLAEGPSDSVVASGRSFLVDPETGKEIALDVVDMWRPVVDPTGRWAVYWRGSLRLSDDGLAWVPDEGALVLGPWLAGLPPDAYGPETDADTREPPAEGGATPTELADEDISTSVTRPGPEADRPIRGGSSASLAESPSSSPTSSATPSTPSSPSSSVVSSPSPSIAASAGASLGPSPEPSGPALPEGLTALVVGGPRDWEVRWDPTGTRFAVWVADAVDPAVGRLSLFTIDPATGALDPTATTLRDEPALAGFALGLGRLAWAVPPGQGGEPSHVRILAWTGNEVGTAVSQPGPGTVPVIVVR